MKNVWNEERLKDVTQFTTCGVDITTAKRNTTKPYGYLVGYDVTTTISLNALIPGTHGTNMD